MRRALAACTSPELFFGRPDAYGGDMAAAIAHPLDNDPLGIAMESAAAMESLALESLALAPSVSIVQ
jgi:hypothetical protein